MFELAFDPPHARPRLAILTIARADAEANRLRPADLDRAESVVDAFEGESTVAGCIVRSGKAGSFLEEIELQALADLADRRDLQGLARRAHAVLRRLERSPRPVVAAIEGACLGIGVELALACHLRIAAASRGTRLGLTQIERGLIPGAGGTYRLPRLIGAAAAARLVVEGRELTAKEAAELGLVDVVVEPEALDLAARDAVARLAREHEERPGSSRHRGSKMMVTVVGPLARRRTFKRLRDEVLARTHGLQPAPLSALDVMERGLSRSLDAAAELEVKAMAELAMGEPSRARVALQLHAETLRATEIRDREGEVVLPSPLQRLGLCGAGTMGADIAVASAEAGLAVRILERDRRALGDALTRVRSQWDRKARASGEAAVFRARTRVSGGLDLAGFETMDFVLEAVPEDLELKRSVFADLQARVSRDTILASHTLALPISAIAGDMPGRDRIVGLRFFRPLRTRPLCEIVRTDHTSVRALASSLAFARRIGKTPIVVRDTPGFYTTRVLGFYLLAAVEMLGEGHSIEAIDAGAVRAGWPIGPLRLLDEVGLDAVARVARVLAPAFPDRVEIPAVLPALVHRGRLGRAAGRGFYRHDGPGPARPDPSVLAFVESGRRRVAATSIDELGDRLTLVAALEAVRCLDDGVIASAADGDVGAVLGIGYPVHRGGPFRHLRQQSATGLRARLASLADRLGPRYEAPAALARLWGPEGGADAEVRA